MSFIFSSKKLNSVKRQVDALRKEEKKFQTKHGVNYYDYLATKKTRQREKRNSVPNEKRYRGNFLNNKYEASMRNLPIAIERQGDLKHFIQEAVYTPASLGHCDIALNLYQAVIHNLTDKDLLDQYAHRCMELSGALRPERIGWIFFSFALKMHPHYELLSHFALEVIGRISRFGPRDLSQLCGAYGKLVPRAILTSDSVSHRTQPQRAISSQNTIEYPTTNEGRHSHDILLRRVKRLFGRIADEVPAKFALMEFRHIVKVMDSFARLGFFADKSLFFDFSVEIKKRLKDMRIRESVHGRVPSIEFTGVDEISSVSSRYAISAARALSKYTRAVCGESLIISKKENMLNPSNSQNCPVSDNTVLDVSSDGSLSVQVTNNGFPDVIDIDVWSELAMNFTGHWDDLSSCLKEKNDRPILPACISIMHSITVAMESKKTICRNTGHSLESQELSKVAMIPVTGEIDGVDSGEVLDMRTCTLFLCAAANSLQRLRLESLPVSQYCIILRCWASLKGFDPEVWDIIQTSTITRVEQFHLFEISSFLSSVHSISMFIPNLHVKALEAVLLRAAELVNQLSDDVELHHKRSNSSPLREGPNKSISTNQSVANIFYYASMIISMYSKHPITNLSGESQETPEDKTTKAVSSLLLSVSKSLLSMDLGEDASSKDLMSFIQGFSVITKYTKVYMSNSVCQYLPILISSLCKRLSVGFILSKSSSNTLLSLLECFYVFSDSGIDADSLFFMCTLVDGVPLEGPNTIHDTRERGGTCDINVLQMNQLLKIITTMRKIDLVRYRNILIRVQRQQEKRVEFTNMRNRINHTLHIITNCIGMGEGKEMKSQSEFFSGSEVKHHGVYGNPIDFDTLLNDHN